MGKAKEAVEDVERVSVERAESDESVSKALQHVSDIVDSITTSLTKSTKTGGVSTQKATDSEDDEADEAEDKAEVVKTTKPILIRDVLKAIGLDGESLRIAAEKLAQAGYEDPGSVLAAKPAKTTKAKAEPTPDPTPVSDEETSAEAPLTIETLGELIQKAKRFTPERIAKLREAHNTLKILLESVDVGDTPKTKVPILGVAKLPGLEPMIERTPVVIKSAEGQSEVLSALADIQKALTALATKQAELEQDVSSVKKARPDSNSLQEGRTETKKAAVTLWSGLL